MHNLDIIVGGQFGSESKGRVTLEVIRKRLAEDTTQSVVSVRVAGPNAGHVVVDANGTTWAMRQIPVGFVEPEVELYIAAGSEIDPDVLLDECRRVTEAGYNLVGRLSVHPEATLIDPEHKEQEAALVGAIGSTGKGIGAARAARVMRTARRIKQLSPDHELFHYLALEDEADWWVSLDGANARYSVVIEGTQGYGLGTHAGHYPQCTSSDCRAIDFLAMAGVNPWQAEEVQVHVVVRPYPIRVAGNSGALKGETSWDGLGLPEERTTVTQKVRRVGEWDQELVVSAIRANGPKAVQIHLAMVDQVIPALAGEVRKTAIDDLPSEDRSALSDLFRRVGPSALGHTVPHVPVASLGTGPASTIWL